MAQKTIKAQFNMIAPKGKGNNGNKSVTIEQLGVQEKDLIRNVGNSGIYMVNNGSKSINKDTKVYRYTSLNTLFSILYSENIHVPNIRSFSDLIEIKGLPKSVMPVRKCSEIDSHWMWLWKERIRKSSLVCASCWTLDDCNGEEGAERFLMWKAYGGGDYCCRLGATIGKLAESIKETKHDMIIGDVVYGDSHIQNDPNNYIFHKTIHYASEQEVRMVVLYNNTQGVNLKIDTTNLFTEVKISPFLPPYLSCTIVGEIRKRLPNIVVERSAIKEYEYLEYLTDSEKRVNGERI